LEAAAFFNLWKITEVNISYTACTAEEAHWKTVGVPPMSISSLISASLPVEFSILKQI
jgi:hypothetical protein